MTLNITRLSTFFILAYIISWLIWLPLYAPAIGLAPLPKLPFHHALGAFGPMLAALITITIFNKKELGALWKNTIKTGSLVLFAVSLLSPFLLFIISALVNNLCFGTDISLKHLGRSTEYPYWSVTAVIIYNVLTFGLGEEVGWRGLALPMLQRKYNALTASVILTLFWAVWHLPLFLYRPGYINMNSAGIVGWMLSLLTGSILLTWLFNSSRGSILLCAIFHATIDVAFTSPAADKHIVATMGILITIWGLLTVFIFGARKLSCPVHSSTAT